jgi:hypothetical protein
LDASPSLPSGAAEGGDRGPSGGGGFAERGWPGVNPSWRSVRH